MAVTVTVACKLPNGLVARVCEKRTFEEAVLGGGIRTGERYVEKARVTFAGPATPYGSAPRFEIRGGYALTPNVDADFWKAFREQNKMSDYIVEGLVFALDKPDAVVAEAKNRATLTSGLEPLNPARTFKEGREVPTDSRWPRSTNPFVSTPEKEDGKT